MSGDDKDMIENVAALPQAEIDTYTPLNPPYQLQVLSVEAVARFSRASSLFHDLDRGISLSERGFVQPGKLVKILEKEIELPVYDMTDQGPVHRRTVVKRELDLSNAEDMHFARYVRFILPKLLHDEGNLSSLKSKPALIEALLDKIASGGSTDDLDVLLKDYKEEFTKHEFFKMLNK